MMLTKTTGILASMFARRQRAASIVVPPRHSPQKPPIAEDQWYPLYCELAEDIDDHFTSTPGHNTRQLRDPLISALNDAAAKTKDADAVRLYDEFPLADNRNIIELIPAMRKALSIDSLQGILTQEHVDAHRTLNELYTRSTTMWDKKAWEKLQTFLLQNLHRSDSIIRIVEDRELYDPKSIDTLLKLGQGTAPALADGLL